jgi:predicted lactoylglutathione lyase
MEIQLSMMILEVRDLLASIAFYRLLGLDLPDPAPGRPVVIHRMGSGVSLLLTTSFAATYDPAWTRPTGGYQQLLEFYVGDDAVVDQRWADLVAAGHPSRMPPTQTVGPYAAMIDDPDGNVVLLTSDTAARVDANDA